MFNPSCDEMFLNAREILSCLHDRQDLRDVQVEWMLEEIIGGRSDDETTAAFLLGLRDKGESALEIAAAAQVLRRHMIRWDPGRLDVLDTCGTGGDAKGTFNISTATAIVLAAAGVPVVKHGNRGVSSRSGSADVLAALGIVAQADPAKARRCLDETGLAFCFAPHFHPALKHVGEVRRRLGVPTIFNCLGPLLNPAGALRQLLGVGRAEQLDRMAQALGQLETVRSLVVHGQDGLDEVTLGAPTSIREVVGGKFRSWEWTTQDFGLPHCTIKDWQAADARDSARIIEEILAGKDGPCSWIVQANVAAALWLAERVSDVRTGVGLAAEAIRSGKARQVLDKLRNLCEDGI